MRRALALLCVMLLARSVDAQPIPGGVRLDTPPAPTQPARRWGLFAGGMTLLLIGYGTDIGLSYGLGVERAGLSFIPVFGPLTQMSAKWQFVPKAQTGNPAIDVPANQRIDAANDTSQKLAYAVLSLDFALQLAGLAMTIAGAMPPRRGRQERARGPSQASVLPGGLGRAGLTVSF